MQRQAEDLFARRRSVLLMVICSALWSIAGILIKQIPWNPFIIAGCRSFIAAGIIALYMIVKKIPLRINRASVLAGVMLSVTFIAFISANKLTTSANAIVLQFTSPIFIILLSTLFYRQRFRKEDYMVVGITIVGISLCFVGEFGAGSMLGNLISLFSGLSLAAMFTITGNTDSASRMSGLLLGQVLTAVIGLPMLFFFDTPMTRPAVVSILLLGVLQLGIPYVLYGIAVEKCSPLVCCLISAIEPLLNPVWVFLFDGESPGVFSVLGGAVVVGTITVWNVLNERKAARQSYEQTPE